MKYFIKNYLSKLFLLSLFVSLTFCEDNNTEIELEDISITSVYIDNLDDDTSNDILDFDNPLLKNIPVRPEIVIKFSKAIETNDFDISKLKWQASTGELVPQENIDFSFAEDTGDLIIKIKDAAAESLLEGTTYSMSLAEDIFGNTKYRLNKTSFSFFTVKNKTARDITSFIFLEKENQRYLRGITSANINLQQQDIEISYYAVDPNNYGDSDEKVTKIKLKPEIIFSGVKISPPSGEEQIFATLIEEGEEGYDKNEPTYKPDIVEYTVTASNGDTKVFKVRALQISNEGLLSPPNNLREIKVTNSTALIVWNSPINHGKTETGGRAKIDYYNITYRPSETNKPPRVIPEVYDTSIELSNLDFDTTYIIQIRAYNSQGETSDPSTYIFKTKL